MPLHGWNCLKSKGHGKWVGVGRQSNHVHVHCKIVIQIMEEWLHLSKIAQSSGRTCPMRAKCQGYVKLGGYGNTAISNISVK